jgi:4-hydroxy-tetrahydrodipicolinate reductase
VSTSTGASPASARIRVVIAGHHGRMGRVMSAGLAQLPGLEVIGGFGRDEPQEMGRLLAEADALVDFTRSDESLRILLAAIEAGVRPVSGTSGLTDADLAPVDVAARRRGIGAIWCPAFHVGAVLMIHFARIAARHFDHVEILESHHAGKLDAPSGTSLAIARAIRAAHGADLTDNRVRVTHLEGTRGGVIDGVRIHSMRLPGAVGRHDVVFAGIDEHLTIRHDESGREGYVSSVALAIRYVMNPEVVGLERGLDTVLGLRGGAADEPSVHHSDPEGSTN